QLDLTDEFLKLSLSTLDGFQSTWGSSIREFRSASTLPHGAGWLLDRMGFEGMLAAKAEHAGATIVPARVRRIQRGNDGWSIASESAVVPSIKARFVTCATGRTGSLPVASRWRALDNL